MISTFNISVNYFLFTNWEQTTTNLGLAFAERQRIPLVPLIAHLVAGSFSVQMERKLPGLNL